MDPTWHGLLAAAHRSGDPRARRDRAPMGVPCKRWWPRLALMRAPVRLGGIALGDRDRLCTRPSSNHHETGARWRGISHPSPQGFSPPFGVVLGATVLMEGTREPTLRLGVRMTLCA